MSAKEIAIKFDTSKQYIEAVNHYEAALNCQTKASVDVYINLSFLYWKFATQLPISSDSETVPDEWSLLGVGRFQVILEKGLAEYPENVELIFWKQYFPYRGICTEFTQKDCEQIIEKYSDKESIVPYFFLYLFDKEKYKEKRNQLLIQCDELATAKNRYIKSIIEN